MLKRNNSKAIVIILGDLVIISFVIFVFFGSNILNVNFESIKLFLSSDTSKGVLIAVLGPFLMVSIALTAVYFSSKKKSK